MGALGLYCELLARPGVLREEHRHYAAELQMISGRSRALIDRLLSTGTTSRSATLAQDDAQEWVIVPAVIEQCRGLLDTIARRAVEVAYEAGAVLPVAMSREALERILVNLTKNAAEASAGETGAITLRVSCLRGAPAANRTDRVVLSVEDKGRGMSSAAVKVLMGDGVDRTGPHGMGFRVVRELVGSSGGRLRLRSDDAEGANRGTTVEVSWAVAPTVDAGADTVARDGRRLRLMARGKTSTGSVQC
jgi:signal transduction histidine kinase